MKNSQRIWQLVDAKKEAFENLSDRVWGMPEIAYTEYRSVAEHAKALQSEGFRITENVAGIPTAIMGEAGEGGPVIAILGEYDVLPGLSQEAGVAEPRPLPGNGHGHGCGHNMLGSAALLAATAVKNLARESRTARTRALLWLSGGGRWRGQDLHGARGSFRRCGRCDLMASVVIHTGGRSALTRQHPDGFQVHRTRVSRSRCTPSRTKRARRGGADECRGELSARARSRR